MYARFRNCLHPAKLATANRPLCRLPDKSTGRLNTRFWPAWRSSAGQIQLPAIGQGNGGKPQFTAMNIHL